MKETAITEKIKKYLRGQGFWVTKLHGSNIQQAGLPDLLAIKNGHAHFFEVKNENGVASPLQLHTLNQLQQHGATAVVVRSVEEVAAVLAHQPPNASS